MINMTLFVQMIHFFIAYKLFWYIFIEKTIKIIVQNDDENLNLQLQIEALKKCMESKIATNLNDWLKVKKQLQQNIDQSARSKSFAFHKLRIHDFELFQDDVDAKEILVQSMRQTIVKRISQYD